MDTNTIYSGLLIDNLNYSVVPEPGTWVMLLGGFGLLAFRFARTRRTV